MNEVLQKLFLVIVVIPLLFSSCGGGIKHGTGVYKAYSDPEKTPKEVATIQMVGKTDIVDYVDWIAIDENTRIDHKKYVEITIIPGTYLIKWGRKFPISPMIKASGSEVRSWSANINFEAGHIYTIHANRTVGQGYIIYSWITDDTQNITIWGTEFVPGPYYYMRD